MSYTLISLLGTGVYKDGYETTPYIFPNKQEYETKLFIEALFKCKYRVFNKLILVGTRTSSWDMLVEKTDGDIDLWSKVYEECHSTNGISDELLKPISECATKSFGIPVVLKVHTPIIDNDTAEQLLFCYSSIKNEIDSKSDVLFDITHSFRSMPILLYQALQASLLNDNSKRKVELVYGEFNHITRKSTVRCLNEYWKYSEITNAINVFKTKLDGFHLAELIEEDWEDGAKVIKSISEIVQTNFCLHIFTVARQIKNVLNKKQDNLPSWSEPIIEILKNISSLIDENHKGISLAEFSKYLYNLNLNTQAVLTLQVAIETAIAEKYGDEDSIGNYNWWTNEGKNDHYIPLRHQIGRYGKYLIKLEDWRNKVAHGGGKNQDTSFPSIAQLPSIYKNGLEGFDKLIIRLSNK